MCFNQRIYFHTDKGACGSLNDRHDLIACGGCLPISQDMCLSRSRCLWCMKISQVSYRQVLDACGV